MYYGWSKEFLEAGKRRLAGDPARAATSDEVKDLCREATALKEIVADLTLENRLLKKCMSGDGGGRRMRYTASEKAEIIQLNEQSHLPAERTLGKLGIPRATIYRWYGHYRTGVVNADTAYDSDHLRQAIAAIGRARRHPQQPVTRAQISAR
jgi:transposase-like protein